MRRILLLASGAGVLVLTLLALFFRPSPSPAQVQPEAAIKKAQPGAQLPISQVILFSSGVGYFQREGEIEGNASIDLSFPVEDINDLLKSLVLRDMGGGQVSAVSYDSHDPIEKTLRSFALDLTENPTFGQLLNQARGEKVEVVLQQTNVTQPGTLTGTIVGLERQRQPAGKDSFVEVELLNLWCADGLRAAKLSDVQRVRFLNPVIDNELKRALEVIALSHDTRKKAVSVSFTGDGKRPVRVGYVIENPIWKTSYRLVLGKDNKPFLQGWAVVENTSDEDWNNVNMALVSGRPISFQMDLYAPLYLRRPVVEPEMFASLRPPTYSGAMTADREEDGKRNDLADRQKKRWGVATLEDARYGFKDDAGAAPMGEGAGMPAGGAAMAGGFGARGGGGRTDKDLDVQVKDSVKSAATASNMGNFFRYVIDQPVNLPRQKSALIPIINQDVAATRVSIYNQSVHPKFPLHGLKFKNTTDLHLMQGPLTVFDGNSYAGDARILDLQPKEERLISYAVDLGVEVETVVPNVQAQHLTKVKIVHGVMEATLRERAPLRYNIKNRTDQDRTLIVEQPFRGDFTLIKPEKPNERTREVYRFEVPVAAGKTATLDVEEERDITSTYKLTSANDAAIEVFVRSPVSSAKVKEALTKTLQLRSKYLTTLREAEELNQRIKEIGIDQGRLRANLKELPPTAAAYKRYLEKFDAQETEIEKLQDQVKKLRLTEEQQRKELEAYLMSLEVE